MIDIFLVRLQIKCTDKWVIDVQLYIQCTCIYMRIKKDTDFYFCRRIIQKETTHLGRDVKFFVLRFSENFWFYAADAAAGNGTVSMNGSKKSERKTRRQTEKNLSAEGKFSSLFFSFLFFCCLTFITACLLLAPTWVLVLTLTKIS